VIRQVFLEGLEKGKTCSKSSPRTHRRVKRTVTTSEFFNQDANQSTFSQFRLYWRRLLVFQ